MSSAPAARAVGAGQALVVAAVLPGFLAAGVAPRIARDFSFGTAEVGLAVAVFYIAAAVSAARAGRFVDRIGPAHGLSITCALTATCTLTIAALADSAAALIALLAIGGIGNAHASPSMSLLLRQTLHGNRHGVGFGVQQAGAPTGALLAGLALPLIAVPLGWRWTFVAVALLALAGAVALPRHRLGAPDQPPDRAAPAGGRLGPVHLFALTAALATAATIGLVAFLVVFAVRSGMSEWQAGVLLAATSAAAAASRVGLGLVADRRPRHVLGQVVAMLVVGAAGFGLVLTAEPALIFAGALIAGGLAWGWPGLLTLASVRLHPGAPAWAVGTMMSGIYAGALSGPLLLGFVAEQAGFTAMWVVCASLSLLAAVAVTVAHLVDRRSPSDVPAASLAQR